MDKVERRLDATVKIVQAGMKMLVKMQEDNRQFKKETREAINALIAAQMRTEAKIERIEAQMARTDAQLARTDAKLDRFIESLSRRNGNGHKR